MWKTKTSTLFTLTTWGVVITLLALFANRPVDQGMLSGYIVTMGFPFQIAQWVGGELKQFFVMNLMVNVALWISAAVCVPYLVWLEVSVRKGWFRPSKDSEADA